MRHLASSTGLAFARRRSRAACVARSPSALRLVIMVKEPHAGRVKTRLGREIGAVAAAGFYRHAACAVLRRLSRSTRWQTWLAVAPDAAVASRCWPAGIPRRAQGRGDLGQRMQRIMAWPGRGPTIIVGTDIPAIEPSHIAAAFRTLGRCDAALGPTPDGGYWLVGLRRSPRILHPFAGVRWSSAHALADTALNLAAARVGRAARLADVDDAGDWRRVRDWSGRTVLPGAVRS